MNLILKIAAAVLCASIVPAVLSADSTDSEKPRANPRPAKPNVVLLLCDDLGWQDVKCYDLLSHRQTGNTVHLHTQRRCALRGVV